MAGITVFLQISHSRPGGQSFGSLTAVTYPIQTELNTL
jgi:hypothetical protein